MVLCRAAGAGLDPYLAVALVVPALFALGAAVYWVILRPLQNEPMMQIFATFGLLMLLQNAVLALTGGAGYSTGSVLSAVSVSIGPLQVSPVRLIVLGAATLSRPAEIGQR